MRLPGLGDEGGIGIYPNNATVWGHRGGYALRDGARTTAHIEHCEAWVEQGWQAVDVPSEASGYSGLSGFLEAYGLGTRQLSGDVIVA